MTDEPKLYTQQEMDDVLEFKNGVIRETEDLVLRLGRQRDDARKAADELAEYLRMVKRHHDPHVDSHLFGRDVYMACCQAIEFYEARDWITPVTAGESK